MGERERTLRLFAFVLLAIVLVVAIVALHLAAEGDADLLGIAHRLEGFLTAVVARTAIELAQRERHSAPAPAPAPRALEDGEPPTEREITARHRRPDA